MAVLVVDALEVVEIDHHHRRRRVLVGAAQQRRGQQPKRRAVVQPGQRVVVGRMREFGVARCTRQDGAEELGQRLEQADADQVEVAVHVGIQHEEPALVVVERGQGQGQHAAHAVLARRQPPGPVERHRRHLERLQPTARQCAERRPDRCQRRALDHERTRVVRGRARHRLRPQRRRRRRPEPGPGQQDVRRHRRQQLALALDQGLGAGIAGHQRGRAADDDFRQPRLLCTCVKRRPLR